MATASEAVHPAANIFPMMDEASLSQLAADIKEHGQREPIVYWKDQILDGRNRLKACEIAGVDPDTCEIDDDDDSFDPYVYVVSVNLHRRHLNESQRGMVAGRLKAHYSERAKERQQEHGGTAPGKGKTLVENLPQVNTSARDEAGAALNVSGKTVDHACTVLAHGSKELINAVERDEVSVSRAAKIAKSTPKREQLAEATKPKAKKSPKAKAPKAEPEPTQKAPPTNIIGELYERYDALVESLIKDQPPHIVLALKEHSAEVWSNL